MESFKRSFLENATTQTVIDRTWRRHKTSFETIFYSGSIRVYS